MKKHTSTQAQELAKLTSKLVALQTKLKEVKQKEADAISIRVTRKDSKEHFERIKRDNAPDTAIGHYVLTVAITARADVYIPLSIASGKKVAGFMYRIEGTGEGGVYRAAIEVHKGEVTQVTLGTLVYTKIAKSQTILFRIKAEIRGNIGKSYRFVVYRCNYKQSLLDARYTQVPLEVSSDMLRFS